MYCQKCGNQMPDNARFCSKCGSSVAATAKPAAEESTAYAQGNPFAAPAAPKEKKPIPAKVIGIAAVAVVVILAAVILLPMLGGGSTFDLKQAYTVSVQGVDGYGAVRLTENDEYLAEWFCGRVGLDPEKVDLDELANPFSAWGYYSFSDGMDVESYTEKVFGKAMTEEELEKMMEEAETIVSALSDLDYEITPESGLSNGDKAEIVFTYDEEAAKEAGLKLKNTQWSHTVEGLTGVATVDLSAAVTVNTERYDGYGRLSFALDESRFDALGVTEEQMMAISNYVAISCSEREGLSNGDSVVFNVSANEEWLARSAVLIEPTRWEYTVEGLEEVEPIDPFEGLKLTCTGVSPYLKVNLDTSACDSKVQQAVTFTLPEGYARNGKPVTVTASMEDYLVEQYGFGLSVESKDIALDTQPEYVTSLSGLDLTALMQELEDTNLANSTGYEDVEQRDSAFLHLKEHKEGEVGSSTPYNQYVILYSGAGNWRDDYGFAVRAWNLCKHPDGTFTWDTSIKWDYNSSGYDAAYDQYITGKRENYVVTNIE